MRLILAVAVFAMVLAFARSAELSPHDRFAKSVAEARANLATPAGGAYDQALSEHMVENSTVLQGCFQNTKEPDATPFEMVFTLSMEGKAQDIAVWPETNIGICFRDGLKSKTFPVPPRDGYLAYMEMRFAP